MFSLRKFDEEDFEFFDEFDGF
ncbi:hypothetical protein CG98_gp053 [Enterobacter phage PG7]|uniref:Uncharacterized protein n=1 Tax=Enterobacter phage PG7 TaxID=1455074 RepID=W6ASM1_9CAUD|nr:hypothetical protein CG98_gp053 [Enterobacter phage PG7]AHI60956.1 hypothetical protein PG7_053 [Enterobacter phage PG7]